MRKHGSVYIIIFSVLIPFFSFSQQNPALIISNPSASDSSFPSPISQEKTNKGFIPKKISSTLQLGTYFTSFSGYGSSFSTYISPNISYPLNSRFRINAGITVLNTSAFGLQPLYSMGRENALTGNFTNLLIFAGGDYLLNDHLTISGALYKELNIFNSVPGKNPYQNINAQGGYLKLDYKVFDNFHIEAGFGYSKGVDPYSRFDPYNNFSGFPYSNSPFIH